MANTVEQLKIAVCGFMQRDDSVFKRNVRGTNVDLLLQAVNNARLYAERKVDFELSKCDVDVPNVSISNGALLSTAVLHGTATTVSVKKIITPYLEMSDGNQYPIDLVTRKAWDDSLRRRSVSVLLNPLSKAEDLTTSYLTLSLVADGAKIFVVPADSDQLDPTFTVYLNVVRWLTPYSDNDTTTATDFLLDNCFDWMMFYCISQLNFFLKEDQRVPLSDSMLRDTWDSLVKWNNELILSTTESFNLD